MRRQRRNQQGIGLLGARIFCQPFRRHRLFTQQRSFHFYSGSDCSLIWSYTPNFQSNEPAFKGFHDVDGDNLKEAIFEDGGQLGGVIAVNIMSGNIEWEISYGYVVDIAIRTTRWTKLASTTLDAYLNLSTEIHLDHQYCIHICVGENKYPKISLEHNKRYP